MHNRCSPPVTRTCYRQEHQGRAFAVIAVSEFHDIPVICTKQYEVPCPGKAPKVLLRKGTVYVRTANVESAPLSSVEEMRQLIGLATTKRADQMLAMFQAMMKGRPLVEDKPNEEEFQREREDVRAALDSELGGQIEKGAWILVCHPRSYRPNRWEETETLKQIVEGTTVQIRRQFPPISHGLHVREWGICNRYYEDAFGLTRSGLFMSARLFRENMTSFKSPWQPNPDIPAGLWVDYKLNLSLIIEFFMFLSRFAENFDVGEELLFEVLAAPLAGRRLVTLDGNINLDPTESCRANVFQRKTVVTVEALRG